MGALGAGVCGVAFTLAAVVAIVAFRPEKATAFVFPGAALLWFGLAFYLLMLGLIGEFVLRERRAADAGQLPVAKESPA